MHTPDFPRRCVRYALGKAGDAGVMHPLTYRALSVADSHNQRNQKALRCKRSNKSGTDRYSKTIRQGTTA